MSRDLLKMAMRYNLYRIKSMFDSHVLPFYTELFRLYSVGETKKLVRKLPPKIVVSTFKLM